MPKAVKRVQSHYKHYQNQKPYIHFTTGGGRLLRHAPRLARLSLFASPFELFY